MLDVKLIRKQHSSYPAIFKAINKNFLPKAGVEVQKRAVKLAPVDQGRLKGSIKYKVTGDKVIIGTNVEYAAYQEYGTYKMTGKPYMRPALDQKRKFLIALWADIYEKVFRVMGG